MFEDLTLWRKIVRIATMTAVALPIVYVGVWAIMYHEYPRVRKETHQYAERLQTWAGSFTAAAAKTK